MSEAAVDRIKDCFLHDGESAIAFEESDWTAYMRLRGPEKIASRHDLLDRLGGEQRPRLVAEAEARRVLLPRPVRKAEAPPPPTGEQRRRQAALRRHLKEVEARLEVSSTLALADPVTLRKPSVHSGVPEDDPVRPEVRAADAREAARLTEAVQSLEQRMGRLEALVECIAANLVGIATTRGSVGLHDGIVPPVHPLPPARARRD